MFTNSRAGTPRRSVAPRSRTGTPARSTYGSPPPGRRSSVGLRQATQSPPSHSQNLAAARVQPQSQHLASSEKTLVVDEYHRVSAAAALPGELQHRLDACGLTYGDMVSLSLDFEAGIALFTTSDFVYAWNMSKKTLASNAITRFAVPPSDLSSTDLAVAVYAPLPLSSLVNYASAREPGLVVCSVDGHIRFWDALSVALTGVERFTSASLPGMEQGEVVKQLLPLSSGSFVLSTSSAKLFRLIIASAGGRTTLSVVPVQRPRGMLSRIGSTFLGLGGALPLSANLGYISVRPSQETLPDGSKIVWAVRARAVESWRLHPTEAGGEMLIDEWDGIDLKIRDQLLEQDGGLRGILPQTLDLQILDAQPRGSDSLVFLLSHAAPAGCPRPRGFALAVVSFASNPPMLEHLSKLSYTADSDPRPLATPKLVLSSRATFIIFADVVLIKNTGIEERVALKQSAKARFIGHELDPQEDLFVATAQHGLLKTEVLDAPMKTGLSPQQLSTAKLTSQLERAVMFADRQDNPLSFELSMTEHGDLAQAAETVSAGLVTSASKYLSHVLDLRSSLAERADRLRSLAVLLNELNLVDKIPELSRQRLAWDAECMAAAGALWQIYNAGDIDRGNSSLLNKAIDLYLSEHGEDSSEDVVRPFFKHRVAYIGQLLEVVDRALKTALNGISMSSSRHSASSRVPLLIEANRIWLAVFSAAERQRKEGNLLYRITAMQGSTKESWTSRPALIEALRFLYDGTEQTLVVRSKELGLPPADDHDSWNARELANVSVDAQSELKGALAEEAEFLLAMHEERLLFLKRSRHPAHEVSAFEQRYQAIRPKIILTLVNVGRPNPAFALAEQHHDFPTLVTLCQDPKVGSVSKTDHYIQKYEASFAFALYDWLISRGQYQTLLTQDEKYAGLLLQYFQQTDNGRISWLHDVALGRFGNAADVLHVESKKTDVLAEQKTMLSIGKLADFAQIGNVEAAPQVTQRWNEKLDVVEMHRVILAAFRQNFSQADLLATTTKQAQMILERYGPDNSARQSLSNVFKDSVQSLVDGRSLSTEDLVDIYTLQSQTTDPFRQDYLEEAEEDPLLKASLYHWNFPPALQLLVTSPDLPTSRLNLALASLWRRTYLRDDWRFISQSANYTDTQLADIVRSTALYQTMSAAQARGMSQNVVLGPSDALFTGGVNVLKARFPHVSLQAVEVLTGDYESESAALVEYIDSCCLQDFFAEAQRLLAAET